MAALRSAWCISDTHNATPSLPPGDILIHAGDLTAHGTFDELQAKPRLIHDKKYDGKFPTRGEEDRIRYLQNEAVTLDVERPLSNHNAGELDAVLRRVEISRSPLSPELGPTGKIKVEGDGCLLRKIRRVQPKLVICGHIHSAQTLVVNAAFAPGGLSSKDNDAIAVDLGF
ncbi:hypothetical protein BDW75DRAFT_226928 [Aspergillus navahoensis]